jgi:hypothetical protein
MSTPNEKPIRSSGVSGLSGPMRAGNPILRRMSEDMLRRAKACEQNEERFGLGNYTFRKPDYNQILAWAKALEMDPLQLLAVLEETSWDLNEGWLIESIKFEVEDGSIISLAWDFERLPILTAVWEQDLRIRSFGTDGPPATGSLLLRGNQLSLQIFDCSLSQLKILDLQCVPVLKMLACANNQLQALDLSKINSLELLICSGNQIKELDLRYTPNLKYLLCEDNQLTELDIQCVPKLKKLRYHNNRIQALDLINLNSLEELVCSENQIKELDLRYTPNLIYLLCEGNQLTELNLQFVPEIKKLWCQNNQLQALDLTKTSSLEELVCSGNQIKELDFQCLPALKKIWCDKDVQLLNCPEGLVITRVD